MYLYVVYVFAICVDAFVNATIYIKLYKEKEKEKKKEKEKDTVYRLKKETNKYL